MTRTQESGGGRTSSARGTAALVGVMAFVWFGLNGTDWRSWIVGGPAVGAAAWMTSRLFPSVSWHRSLAGALAFAGFFARESFRGSWDVAQRALAPRLRLRPSMVSYPLRLPAGPGRWLFCNSISLLPGTAVVAITSDQVLVHVLHVSPSVRQTLGKLEDRVAAVFGLKLPEPGRDVS